MLNHLHYLSVMANIDVLILDALKYSILEYV